MRLIDADALIDKLQQHHDFYVMAWGGFGKMPTGEKRRVDEITNCIAEVVNAPTIDRPQGEWIRTGRTNIYGGIEVQCSNCGDRVMVQHLEDEWYCRHCGADMGMKGADDE